MLKNYFYTAIILFFCLFSLKGLAQENKQQSLVIEGLALYPNPASNGKVYITSKSSIEKEVMIFDVLGKKILHVSLSTKELSISSLSPGVYIIKIREGEATATRKLIVK